MTGSPPRVVHVNDRVPGAVYVGRAVSRRGITASPFRNPFWIVSETEGDTGLSREDAIAMFRVHMTLGEGRPMLSLLPELRNTPALACWCRHDGEDRTPENECHADVLVELLNRYTDDELRELGGAG